MWFVHHYTAVGAACGLAFLILVLINRVRVAEMQNLNLLASADRRTLAAVGLLAAGLIALFWPLVVLVAGIYTLCLVTVRTLGWLLGLGLPEA